MSTLQETLRQEAKGTPFEELVNRLCDDPDQTPGGLVRRMGLSIQMAIDQANPAGERTPHQRQLLVTQFDGFRLTLNAMKRHVVSHPGYSAADREQHLAIADFGLQLIDFAIANI